MRRFAFESPRIASRSFALSQRYSPEAGCWKTH